jgi:hypothetical protein
MIGVILTIITSILFATHPDQMFNVMKVICSHLLPCVESESNPDEQIESKEAK